MPQFVVFSWFFCSLLCLASLPVWAVPQKTITFGALLFEGSIMMDEQNNVCYGPTVDTTRKIFADSGVGLEVICGNPARIYFM